MTFEKFPKSRSPLPGDLAAIYDSYYKANRKGQTPATSVAQKMERWLHRRVADDVADSGKQRSTLEVGAGTLNQLRFESASKPYDVVEPFTSLYAGSPLLHRIRNIYSDISEVPSDHRYDRITSVATFEHICDLPTVVARCGLLLEAGGQLRAAIPSEGTLLWTLGWKLTTGLEFKVKYGIDYGILMRHEHVNTAREIEEVLRHFFANIECRVMGISRSLSFYQFFACDAPDLDRCRSIVGAGDVTSSSAL